MRFGQNFHSYTVPEWDSLYIDYSRLKQLIKAPLINHASANHVEQSVLDALTRLHSSELDLYLSLIQRHELLFSSHLVTQQGTAPDIASLLQIIRSDVRRYVQGATFDLQSSLQRLQWFERVNHEAVNRIFVKLRKSYSHSIVDLDAILSEWRRMQEVVDQTKIKASKLVQDAIERSRASEVSATLPSAAFPHTHPSHGLDTIFVEAIIHDSPDALGNCLAQHHDRLQPEFLQSLFKVLALRHSWQCLKMLASRFTSSLDPHCLAVLFCSLRVHSDYFSAVSVAEASADDYKSTLGVVCELFSKTHETITQILCQTDNMGCSPLHYAMKNGFDMSTAIRCHLDEEKCQVLLLSSMLSGDNQGLTPLHLATIEGHSSVVASFFSKLPVDFRNSKAHEISTVATACLNIAIRMGNDILAKSLPDWADIKNIAAQGQSAFHLAARAGRCDYVTALINACASENLNFNMTDSCGRTPLMDASVRGHISVVEVLLKAGADPLMIDNSAWTARKYAVHRGHLAVAALLPNPANTRARHSMDSKAIPLINASPSAAPAVASRGPLDHTLVIYLGSMRLMDNRPPVRLMGTSGEMFPGQKVPKLHHLELSVNPNKQPQIIYLPFLEDQSSKPVIFQLDAEVEPQLLIRLFEDDLVEGPCPSLLAAGAVSLRNSKPLFGHQRESLIREHTIILLSTESQETVGTVLLTCVIARPFGHLQTPIPMPSPASHKSGRMALVGHRGFGMNVVDPSQLQLGENTIGSFITAADHGATFVEFDAQVSKDLQTVIYHDFSLSETGTDIPIHDLTIDQYKYASSIQTPQGSPLIGPDERTIIGKSVAARRSRSCDGQKDFGALLIRDRLKHTVDFKSKAMKPNIRGDVIQEPLVTLPELFQKLPPSLGFNIEIKYPRLHEASDAGVAPIALEINVFVDTVLEQIHRFADQRPIILSSFTPEVCILLSLKQKAYPVLFITNAGKLPAADLEKRVASLQAGVHFAKTWGLAGLCLASEPLLLYPELIGDIKRSSLLCASYGPQNCAPENVLIQRDAGLDMAVVDKVALIARALKLTPNEERTDGY